MHLTPDVFFLDQASPAGLQTQIRQIVASAVLAGRFKPGDRLPSTRKLADHLKISRITVTLAYQELIADGYLETQDRSGCYVSHNAPAFVPGPKAAPVLDKVDWSRAIKRHYSGARLVEKTLNWRDYPYPFIYGQADPELFDHSNWRICAHKALGKRDFDSLTGDYADVDDPQLVDFITRHTLPRRSIVARPENVLITLGAQNALWMISRLLIDRSARVAYENPGYPGLREILSEATDQALPINVDENGLNPADLPTDLSSVFVTPSHHAPTTVTMPLARRKALLERARDEDFLVVEDDYEFEMSFSGPPTPALKSLDTDGRVLYVGSFSKSLFPGLRLGYLVGPADFIKEARALRAALLRHPPGHIQRTTAYFLGLGHYDALIGRMRTRLAERREVMQSALDKNGLTVLNAAVKGGTSFWLAADPRHDIQTIATQLAKRGVLIEPGMPFFAQDTPPRNFFRLAYSSIPLGKIETGVEIIAKELAS